MRVEALGYCAAHAAHQEVMRAGLQDGRGVRGSPLRFVPRNNLCKLTNHNLIFLNWPVSAPQKGPAVLTEL